MIKKGKKRHLKIQSVLTKKVLKRVEAGNYKIEESETCDNMDYLPKLKDILYIYNPILYYWAYHKCKLYIVNMFIHKEISDSHL